MINNTTVCAIAFASDLEFKDSEIYAQKINYAHNTSYVQQRDIHQSTGAERSGAFNSYFGGVRQRQARRVVGQASSQRHRILFRRLRFLLWTFRQSSRSRREQRPFQSSLRLTKSRRLRDRAKSRVLRAFEQSPCEMVMSRYSTLVHDL